MRPDNYLLLVGAWSVFFLVLWGQINALVFGALAGLTVAVGGAIKDAPGEGFSWKKFVRSPIVGFAATLTLNSLFVLAPVVSFLACIGVERSVIETYKIYRAKLPGKFSFGEWGEKV